MVANFEISWNKSIQFQNTKIIIVKNSRSFPVVLVCADSKKKIPNTDYFLKENEVNTLKNIVVIWGQCAEKAILTSVKLNL